MGPSEKLSFEGRVAVVTGAGRGIGRSHALALAARGAAVVVNDLGGSMEGGGSSDQVARAVVEEIRAAGGTAVASSSPVHTDDGAKEIAQVALDTYGRIDVLINNAGIMDLQEFEQISLENLDAHLAVHLRGTFLVSQAVWPHMRAAGYGRVVNTTSAAVYGNPTATAYTAAKSGVIGFTRSLALEGAPHGIVVNALSPFATTRMAPAELGGGRPEDVSQMALFLAHERVSVSGETLFVSGRRAARICFAETVGIEVDGLTPEIILDRISDIVDTDGAQYPSTIAALIS